MMLELTKKGLAKRPAWEAAGFALPSFDLDTVYTNTKQRPQWIHFGGGNIFRGFIAVLQQQLLEKGLADTGIIAAEAYDEEIITKSYQPNDNLTALVIMRGDGSFEKRVVASVAEGLAASPGTVGWQSLQDAFCKASLQMVSFTITEKGYALKDIHGNYFSFAQQDFAEGPASPQGIMARLCALMYARYQAGGAPVALVSMDNCSHNGDKLRESLLDVASHWAEKGFVEEGFPVYLADRDRVSYPLSMIDKITPAPAGRVKTLLEEAGLSGMETVKTAKNSCVAPFVNAEKAQYLVIEDWFPNGRPPLEEAGVYFTGRETVDQVEKMKVCTCLNPLHTALAVFGCILGFTAIWEEMQDPQLVRLIEKIGYEEGLPVVVNPGIIDPKDFIREVLQERLPNPNMPDTPQRIASDTSQKVSIRFGETLKAYQEKDGLNPSSLTFIPLAIAGWCRYLLAVNDRWEGMELSPDPMLEELTSHLKCVQLGGDNDVHRALEPILSNAALFAVDLYEVGLGEKIEQFFAEMIVEKGGVRKVLEKYLS